MSLTPDERKEIEAAIERQSRLEEEYEDADLGWKAGLLLEQAASNGSALASHCRKLLTAIDDAERRERERIVAVMRMKAAEFRCRGNDLDGITIDELADQIEKERGG